MRLVLLGLPGAGKGTQGDKIAVKYNIPHISTGKIIRDMIASNSLLGQEANSYIAFGNLIPDNLAIQMLTERLLMDDCKEGWVLDGFPRTVLQALHLDKSLGKKNSVNLALDVRISEIEAIRRVEQRRICDQCGAIYHLMYCCTNKKGFCDKCGYKLHQRADDTIATARRRLNVHMRKTNPVIHYYAQDGRLSSVNGNRIIEEVFADIELILLARLVHDYERIGDRL